MRVEVLGGLERRRRWSQDDKARIVEETLVPGAAGNPASAGFRISCGFFDSRLKSGGIFSAEYVGLLS
jgi:hypothetical protein